MVRRRGLSAGPVAKASFHSFHPNSNARYNTPFPARGDASGLRFVECFLRVAVMIELLSRKRVTFLDGACTVQRPFYARLLLIVSDKFVFRRLPFGRASKAA